jgi:hypothetical protein
MQLTQREKYGRNGMNISITRNDYHKLEDLRKLLTLKSRPAVIHFLIERFVEDLNSINKNKE